MNTSQLQKFAMADELLTKRFIGVFPADKLPRKSKKNTALIANTDPSNETGEHWVCFFVDDRHICTYFDSYGNKPKPQFQKFIKSAKDLTTNNQRLQSSFSTCCGQYCLMYLSLRSRSYSHSQILNLFDANLEENDEFVVNWVNENFDSNLPDLDFDYIISQISRNPTY